MKALLFMLVVSFLLFFTIVGTLFADSPLVGSAVISALALAAYGSFRAGRAWKGGPWLRRAAFASGAFFSFLALGSAYYSLVQTSYRGFVDWHAGGAGVRVGMSVDEATKHLQGFCKVTDTQDAGFKEGVRLQLEPVGIGAQRFEFPLDELYYLDVALDKGGRVASVKPWHD